jgi:hypothetical protein
MPENATVLTARNAVRHQIRDGLSTLDATPVPFNMVRLEPLTDQVSIAATPTQTVFQVRYDLVPTQEHMTVTAVPATLVAFVDGSWTPTLPTKDVDAYGNFTLPSAPVKELLVSYAWQYLSDGEIDQFVEESRRWLREFGEVSQIPDGLTGALARYASALALRALMRTANIADQKAGDTGINFSDLAKSYATQAKELETRAQADRDAFYSRSSEALEPFVESGGLAIPGYQPLR